MQGGTVEIRFNDHVIKAKMIELNIEHDNMRLGTTYRTTAIDNYLSQLISKGENPMSDLRTAINNNDLPEPTKTLRERGIEGANGLRTAAGTEILLDLLYKKHRDEIAKALETVKVEPQPAADAYND